MFRRSDFFLSSTLWSCAVVGSGSLIFILAFLLNESIPIIQQHGLLSFINDEGWHPLEEQYNLLPMISGTVLICLGALLLALPLSIGCALFLVYFCPAGLQTLSHRLLEILGGIPSVVYGLWGMLTVVPLISQIRSPGTSLLAASIVLSMMLIPALSLMIILGLQRSHQQHYLSARALGLSKTQTILKVILPVTRPSITSAVFLQSARAVGETMAVLMVCGNVVQNPQSIFDPVRTLTTNVALEMAYAMDFHRSALFVSGLLLLLLVAFVLILSRTTTYTRPRVSMETAA